MQSTATLFEGPPQSSRDRLLCWFRLAASVVVAGAVLPAALAQAPADPAAGEKTEAASEPQRAAGPDAASHPESEVPAQWNRRPRAPTGVEGNLRRLTADLKLDAGQQAKVRTILVARTEQMQHLQHDTRLTPAQRRERVLAIGDRSAEQIRAQLTDAQRAQYIGPRAPVVAQARPAVRRGGVPAATLSAPSKGATR